jgi:AAA+ ATPase superfamily predicted ATPase
MKFYNREKEIEHLRQICKKSAEYAQFTVITGRRRIGKTRLLLKATEGLPTLYFFVSRKADPIYVRIFSKKYLIN